MNRRNAMLFVLVLAALAAATYVASCHCGPPAGDGRGAPVPLATHASRLTTTVTTDTDFLTAILLRQGYGGQDRGPALRSSKSEAGYGIETRDFGLANVNPTVTG
ncbi:MAG: hypothetical protein HY897_15510 [Deltaproteobacteria bacterium]|nr:hypothetical protein [Deltaproteobacteria bacterium]